MMAEPLAAALHGVAKHYHGFTLGPLNLEIPAGSIVGLIGEKRRGQNHPAQTADRCKPPGCRHRGAAERHPR